MERDTTDEKQPLLLTVGATSKLLGLSPSAVYRLVGRGRLKKVDIGSAAIRIPRAAIDRLIEQAMSGEAERTTA